MMKVKVEKFCSLSTSPSWQAWLFHFDQLLYQKFIKRLQESKGCNHNRDVMIDILGQVEATGGSDKLLEFLQTHYPSMVISDQPKEAARAAKTTAAPAVIFEHYNPGILTYPRRLIITGTELEKRIRDFVLDKVKYDSVVVGDKAYIEYLTRDDIHLKDAIPQKNWQIARWRLRTSKT